MLQLDDMKNDHLYPRYLLPRIIEALDDSPVVLIHGPRQCGKTTLTRYVAELKNYQYFTFDDDVQRAAAQTDPVGYVAELPERVVLDEVQRVPELFTSLKAEIDKRRVPGRFILTGSAHVLFVPSLADSLAGRIEILRLHPLSHVETVEKPSHFLSALFSGTYTAQSHTKRLGTDLAEYIVNGGFPAALKRRTSSRRATWYRNYIDTLVQRDIRELGRIHMLDSLPRLLTVAAGRTAQLLNISELAAPFNISRTTIRDYVTLLSHIFLLEELPSWHSNRTKRLVKTPKLHLGDTGLVCALLGLNADTLLKDRSFYGHALETFIYQELRRQASWQEDTITFSHFRNKDKIEVDCVLECSGKIAGCEVKAGSTVKQNDFKGLQKLQMAAGKQFTKGVVLYDGEATVPFGKNMYAVPISSLLEGTQ